MSKEKTPIIKAIKKVMPAVVSVVISKHLEEVEKELASEHLPFLPFEGEKKLDIPEENIDSRGMVRVGGGSGFVVREDGLILTNKHVISATDVEYTVVTNDEKKHKAEIIARDPINDVAILKIEATNLPTIELGKSSELELGQTVIAFGNALGLFKNTVSSGIISGLSRYISAKADPEAPMQELRGLIQTDAAINPGNSGGPLVDINGRVIGINAAIVFGAQNIGFAIPIDAAKRDLSDLKKYGRIKRPLLGLRYLILNEGLQRKLNLPVSFGALVIKESPRDHGIVPDSPAHKAGLKEGDIILECNNEKIDHKKTPQDFLENLNVGDEICLKVLRQGKEFIAKAQLTERK